MDLNFPVNDKVIYESNDENRSINILSIIRSKEKSLANSEKKVSEWVQINAQKVVRMSMAQVAHECDVSDTTVLRFCRSIGLLGFTDLKLSIVRDISKPHEEILGEITPSDDLRTITQKVFQLNAQALNDTVEVINFGSMAEAVELIRNARRILIIGVGTSGPIVRIAENYFLRLGLNCKSITDSYLQLMEASLLDKEDLVIGVSHSGYSLDPVHTVKVAKERGSKTICITGNDQAPITEYADVVLLSVSREERAETIASRLAQISIIDALYVILSIELLETAANNEKIIWDAIMSKMV